MKINTQKGVFYKGKKKENKETLIGLFCQLKSNKLFFFKQYV
jgi:hypothetical protein